jgi:hypothetical protein
LRFRSLDEIVELLERAGEYRAAEILRLRADPKRIERLAAELDEQAVDPNLGDWMRLRYSDAGLYLDRIAEPRERIAGFLARVAEVRETLARDGRWSESWEWRIMTVGTETIEALPGRGFRALAEHHGTFRVDFATFPEAWEALRVLVRIQHDLFYAVGWDSSEPQGQHRDPEEQYAYLSRLAREARADGADRPVRSAGVRKFEYEVADGSFSMASASPTPERAREFAGIYERLQRDLRNVLHWRWLDD